ncbi:TetR/AcrR family transcriptional regulator [Microlunatus flavus]|uniref:DNA-binding transcriptional regulator, AcrR family n=1 Tax=Microlunatus flavus TaxID=1036181 RepID=A0A1H9GXY0_9ACTN|nr:TetR/AcrR family transcriptional regulator [Microlunatus flavus]SEQ54986.1 DNA-binding transcriptional regulator, AcrR family [Microlunatus flavus]
MASVTGTARPLRADARRNRDAIITAAREAFEADGVLTPLDAVATRAGVGNATLYRNFPTRDDLLAEVMQAELVDAFAEADELARTLPPREALTQWLVRLAWQLRIWHDLPYCLANAHAGADSPVSSTCNPVHLRLDAFLDAARASGDLHADVDGATLYELVLAVSWATDRFHDDQDAARRRVLLTSAGLFA